MSEKLRQPDAPMTQLKEVWNRLPEPARDYWRDALSSSRPQSELRAEILSKFKIKLGNDGKVSKFRAWIERADQIAQEMESQQDDESAYRREHPNASLEEVRDEVLKRSYFRTLSTGNFPLGLKTVAADVKSKQLTLDRDKFQFDAVAACRKQLPQLQAVEKNSRLTEAEKNQAIHDLLFPT